MRIFGALIMFGGLAYMVWLAFNQPADATGVQIASFFIASFIAILVAAFGMVLMLLANDLASLRRKSDDEAGVSPRIPNAGCGKDGGL
jgi:TRAP-type C4-dicarboxylate transport system permease small subunit